VLGAQIGVDRTVGYLFFLVGVSMSAWGFGHFAGVAASAKRQLVALAGAFLLSSATGYYFLDMAFADESECATDEVTTDLSFADEIPWQAFSGERVASLAGSPVLIDFTADWCLTCKANERTILDTTAVRTAMSDLGIVPLKADWTRQNPEITEWLRRHGRAGVPMYLIIPADASKEAILLPEVITQGMVIEALEEGAS